MASRTKRLPSASSDKALQNHVAAAWLDSQRSTNTRAAYRIDLDALGAWCAAQGSVPLLSDTNTLIAFQAAREAAGDSPATLRRRWSALSSFFDFAVDNDAILTNPADSVSRPRVLVGDPSPTVQLSRRAVEVYRSVAAGLDPRLDALVALIVADGLKMGEALALDVNDVKGRAPKTSVMVRRRGTTKRIILDIDSARAVRRCIGRRRDGPVFTAQGSGNGRPRRLTRFGADHLIRQLTPPDSSRVTANELRRFHITSSHAADTELDNVRDRAGLADVRGVQRYLTHQKPQREGKED